MRTPKGLTKVLIDRLLEMGVSKWKIAYGIGLGKAGRGVSYKNVQNWQSGKYEAGPKNVQKLQEIYFEQCKLKRVGLFSPIRTDSVFKHKK